MANVNLDLEEGFALGAEEGSSSVEPTPRAFAFDKRGIFPKEGEGIGKPAEELVEIKPRQRPEDAQSRATADGSAFDELPGAEVYDPSWNTNPLRCEAGNLGKGGKGQDQAEKPSLLPTAFTLGSSADLEDDDEDVVEGANLDDIENIDTSSHNPSSPHSSKYNIYGMKRAGAMSFLSRKKVVAAVLFQSDEDPESVSGHLKELLKEYYSGEILQNKTNDVKARAKVPAEDPSAAPAVTQFVIAIESGEEPGKVRAVLRRSKADKQKSTAGALHSFCVELSSRYQDLHSGCANLSKILADQSSDAT